MFDVLYSPEYWFGAASGALLTLVVLAMVMIILGRLDERAEQEEERAMQRTAGRYPRLRPVTTHNFNVHDGPVAARPRTARSELRSRPR